MRVLETIGPDNWREFIAAPTAVLLIGKSDCKACIEWSAELAAYLSSEEAGFIDVRFGKLLLDQRGLIDFKKENAWLAEVKELPFTVIFRNGERFKEFAGGGLARLTGRLESSTA